MPFVHFDSKFAPCAFLIVKDGGDPYTEADTVLIQTDWDYPAVASRMGWTKASVAPHLKCKHEGTDGTVKCRGPQGCGLEPGDFISAAYDYIREHQGETFADLEEYFEAC